ncbi:hypothetical protein [Pleionea sediminis]|uniref:hypothetical protein n=1 Tax=Pleionea sediminis TaxID=2569479 RepID=UPI001186A4F2|nr:hypothetical protein [Pleionea sediminis]
MKSKRKLVIGSVFKIHLEEKGDAFGVLCYGNEVAFYDFVSNSDSLPEDLLGKKLAFRVPVATDELENLCWPIVGVIKVPAELAEPGRYLNKPIGSTESYVYQNGELFQATDSDIESLEILTVWFSVHVEERLKEYFDGKVSIYDTAIRKQLDLPLKRI